MVSFKLKETIGQKYSLHTEQEQDTTYQYFIHQILSLESALIHFTLTETIPTSSFTLAAIVPQMN